MDAVNTKTDALRPILNERQIESLFEDVDPDQVQCYIRASINGIMYHTVRYKTNVKFSYNTEVMFEDELQIAQLEAFVLINEYGFAVVRLYDKIGVHSLGKYPVNRSTPSKTMNVVNLSQIRRLVGLNHVKNPIIYGVDGDNRANRTVAHTIPIFY
ncbi:hypothetical protein AKO1_001518 [Acrasis kona]|uniref:Uncharacterized protein n=1 Tax=Acrasis kona TaxID=1008807 RepID=A0AAW2ZRJ9_9EUKA